RSIFSLFLLTIFVLAISAEAQKRINKPISKTMSPAIAKPREIGSTAMVIDEDLSVLRDKPSLFAEPVQRMRRGRKVVIQGVAEADGVKFYKVAAPPAKFGWVQAD